MTLSDTVKIGFETKTGDRIEAEIDYVQAASVDRKDVYGELIQHPAKFAAAVARRVALKRIMNRAKDDLDKIAASIQALVSDRKQVAKRSFTVDEMDAQLRRDPRYLTALEMFRAAEEAFDAFDALVEVLRHRKETLRIAVDEASAA